jgi:hypothetical protein
MKKILTIILTMSSMVFTQSGINIIGGITYSTTSGDDWSDTFFEGIPFDVNNESKLGFRFGAEKTMANGLIAGATYSNRGGSFSSSETLYEGGEILNISIDVDMKFGYLTGYLIKPFPFKEGIDLLAGAEIGYFRNMEMKAKIKGEVCYDGDCEQVITENINEDMDADDWQDDADGNMMDYGIVFGGRYAINEQMSLVGTYYFGLAEATDDISDKHRGFQINISYALQ